MDNGITYSLNIAQGVFLDNGFTFNFAKNKTAWLYNETQIQAVLTDPAKYKRIGTLENVHYNSPDDIAGTGDVQFYSEVGSARIVAFKGVQGVGKFSLHQIDEYVVFATKNKNASKVMLGKYLDGGTNSYIQRAGNDHTYFDLGSIKWKEAQAFVNKNVDEMWKINKKFIDEQNALNKVFYFLQEPWKAQTHEYLSKEAEYLIDLGAKDFQKINENTWKVIW